MPVEQVLEMLQIAMGEPQAEELESITEQANTIELSESQPAERQSPEKQTVQILGLAEQRVPEGGPT